MPSELIRWPRKSTVGAAKVHLSGRTLNPFSWGKDSTSLKCNNVPCYCPRTQASLPCI